MGLLERLSGNRLARRAADAVFGYYTGRRVARLGSVEQWWSSV
jgi:hypothetical protein